MKPDGFALLMENFDAEVAEKLSVYRETSARSLSRYEALLWEITKGLLDFSLKASTNFQQT